LETALSMFFMASLTDFSASLPFADIKDTAFLRIVFIFDFTALFLFSFLLVTFILFTADFILAISRVLLIFARSYYVIITHVNGYRNMTLSDWLPKKKPKVSGEYKAEKLDVPGSLWVKCYKCHETIYSKDLEKNLKVCPKCSYHFKLSGKERISMLLDEASFSPYDISMRSKDFLGFFDTAKYEQRILDYEAKTSLLDAVVTGEGTIKGKHVVICAMDFSFMGGSMGSVVGEKITRAIEKAIGLKVPVIICATSGGARMQESIMSLMQMAKTSGALAKLAEAKLPYISLMADPTTGGVSASFAMLGDINMAEPGALIGFAGPRVIEQTIRQKLPAGFQRAEYLVEHGMMDMVVERSKLKETIVKCLSWFGY